MDGLGASRNATRNIPPTCKPGAIGSIVISTQVASAEPSRRIPVSVTGLCCSKASARPTRSFA